MKILVIGNGFDLEHGLPTKYKDFLDFMQGIKLISSKTNVADKNAFIEELERKHKVDENIKTYFTQEKFLNPDYMKEWKEEKTSKELIDGANNIWIKYFLENMDYEKEGWIDLESEISSVVKCFEYAKTLSLYLIKNNQWPQYRDNYKEKIVEKIIGYSGFNTKMFKLVDKDLIYMIDLLSTDLSNLIHCLEIYIEECVKRIDIKYLTPDIKHVKFDKVLSFNYTNTYERIYGFNSGDIEYHYIHGNADISRVSDENNMVLGIDEYLDDESKNKELEFIAFKKYFQRIYKKTGNEYRKWILRMKDIEYETIGECDEIGQYQTQKIKNEVYIFGHSLDITDKDIIKELIECPNTETTIFYYDKGVYAQQIANLVKVIGQDELTKRVSGANPTIVFKQQQKKIERN
ncbi:uncharacterized protein YihD (DUF1040 family) [Clostridium beijerinckii]|uniref:bacteriophage abortive infection AbiH family protein n=1 Tax=Clostridium beijerinckii TaxID=1520 RepID=UPI001494684A|nr:bacteriophage abortive infection AbiH family protein [Clostridium beijerinckii]NOW92377.1 uncharacterized protein YihD (DUF1040 family) [Clostridium beijerinckii]